MFFVILFLIYENIKDKKTKDIVVNDYNIKQIQKKFANLFSDSIIILDNKNIERGKIKVIIDGSNLWPMTMHGKKMKKIKRN